ncbi:hypothetical protein Cfor_04301, partial [Coptotermes formosanus]
MSEIHQDKEVHNLYHQTLICLHLNDRLCNEDFEDVLRKTDFVTAALNGCDWSDCRCDPFKPPVNPEYEAEWFQGVVWPMWRRYTIAVLNQHVEPGFPYISDTGTVPPESCIFGQLLNIAAFMLAVCVYIKYLQVQSFSQIITPENGVSHTFNKVALSFGLTSCVGLDIVANFQESNVIVVHMLGAFLCFAAGTIYFILQAICSYYLHPLANSIVMAHMRVVLAMVCTVFFILLSITGVISHLQFHGKDPRKWYPEDGGWEMHVASTVSEWIVATSFCVYILSFVQEFRAISIEEPQ